ncbi:hypothetical protein IWT25_01469 [Secundilactobacillus pentosiphilus]|uniref:S-layer protein n=1 Tax=Secundilactobacillus pentosiphilus TaxID=1714682 RepID=A0A1Z5IWI3_9LACO|nr:hypothetical protein [Secundilactobacillus pentosiphilus]GAX06144.1 hypothetical protein IWT25_01469 [Secundilactobacillus pentosiphilus]
MQSSLKKSLYLGLAAVSFAAVAGTSVNASAKSYAKLSAPSTVLTTAANTRNVNLTGTNAIYSKPGTVKGAKVVATTTTAKRLAASKNGSDNFRAYRVVTTDRGSVYYKVVSYDKQYRGYVYGGKSTSAFAGGLVSYATTKDATAPKASDSYSLTADTSATANTLFYKEPAYTNYKVGRAVVNGAVLAKTDAYKGATFTFNKAVTTSREGDTWYQIASTKLSNGTTTKDLDGAWIKASNVKNDNALNPDTQVAVTVKDVANGNEVASFNYTTGVTGNGADALAKVQADGTYTTDFQSKLTDALKGSGYTVGTKDAVNKLNSVKNGGSVTVYAVKNGQKPSAVAAWVSYTGAVNSDVKLATTTDSSVRADADSAQKLVLAPSNGQVTLFTGTEGAAFTSDQALSFLNGSSFYKELKSPVFKDGAAVNGVQKYAQYVYTPSSAKAGQYGTAFEAHYNVQKVTVSAPTTTNPTNPVNPFA